MANSRVKKEVNRVFQEIQEYIEENKDKKEKIGFNRNQLKFLKADVRKTFIPFKRAMQVQKNKKDRRAKNLLKKL